MATAVRSRPNHYELLGLTPAATDEDISRAFAREIGPHRPRPLGGTAAICVAFETLRDPVRRRDYDASLGLTPKPAPAPRLEGWHFAGHVRVSHPGLPAAEVSHREEPKPVIEAPPETAAEPQPEPFIAEAPLESEAPEPHVEAEPPHRPAIRHSPRPAPLPGVLRSRPVPMDVRILPMEEAAAVWKRPAILAVALFVAVALLGVLAGLWASRDVGQQAPEAAVTLPVAPTEAHAATIVPEVEPAPPPSAEPRRERDARPAASQARARSVSTAPEPVLEEAQRAEDVPEIPSEEVAALTSQASEMSATLPLSDSTVARTLSRIGYSCGKVASTSAVDGAPGVFKVTCSSGQSYKATPIGGRYRFRRWAG